MANADRPSDPAATGHEDLKPGSPPRHASEPEGSETTSKPAKTLTDPHTGAPRAERKASPS